jgi:hypothetical protein
MIPGLPRHRRRLVVVLPVRFNERVSSPPQWELHGAPTAVMAIEGSPSSHGNKPMTSQGLFDKGFMASEICSQSTKDNPDLQSRVLTEFSSSFEGEATQIE